MLPEPLWPVSALLAALALALGGGACGGDDDSGVTAAVTSDAAAGESVAIVITDFVFDPAEFTVPAGVEVTFLVSNLHSAPHTFTVYADQGYDEATAVDIATARGESGVGVDTFKAGDYYFRCELHPDTMLGEFLAE